MSEEFTLFTDGGARGNPGPAGAGAVLLDQKGQEVAAYSRYLGRTTNNQAEYQALIIGLEGALTLKIARLKVWLDSELVVRQMNGQYKVKNPGLKPLYLKALGMLGSFEQVVIGHVPRARNKRADELANQAMDQGA